LSLDRVIIMHYVYSKTLDLHSVFVLGLSAVDIQIICMLISGYWKNSL